MDYIKIGKKCPEGMTPYKKLYNWRGNYAGCNYQNNIIKKGKCKHGTGK